MKPTITITIRCRHTTEAGARFALASCPRATCGRKTVILTGGPGQVVQESCGHFYEILYFGTEISVVFVH